MSAVPVFMLSSPAMAQNASEALPDIRVVAPSEAKSGTTEGTRSYTTKSMSTATGLNLSVRETPQAVSVVTRERLDDQNLLSITDVINNVTGVSGKAFDSSRVFFTARGFNITSLLIDGLPVNWDGAWNGGENLADMAMYDRVEVVRGATGLMNGVGSPSAAINMARKHATSEVFTGTATLGLGSWNDYRAEVDLSSPLTKDGRVRGRIVGSVQDKDTFRDFEHIRKSTVYAVVDADLTKDTFLSVGVSRQENKPKGITWGGLPMWFSDGTRAHWDSSKSGGADWTRWYSTQDTYFATLEQRFDNGWKAKLNYSHVESDADSRLLYISGTMDRLTGLGLGAFATGYETTRKQDDVGIEASGPFNLLGRKHEATVGFLHSKQDFDATDRAASGGGSGVGNFYEWDGSYAEPTWGASSFYETSKVEQSAVYGAVRFSLADPLHLIVGARATNWKGEGIGRWVPVWKNDYKVVTPYAGLVFDVTPEYSLFASYTDIFQPQTKVGRDGRYLEPMTGKTFEAGVKGELLRGKLNGSLSAFFTKQSNVGKDANISVPGGVGGVGQPAYDPVDTISKGYEAEISGQLAAGWDASIGWSQFRLKDLDGDNINPNHPRRMLKVFTKYRLPGELNKLTFGGGVNWESASYTENTAGTDRWTQASFSLVSLMARYDFSEAVSAQLNVSNAFDKKYAIPNDTYKQLTYGEPRAVALTLKYRF